MMMVMIILPALYVVAGCVWEAETQNSVVNQHYNVLVVTIIIIIIIIIVIIIIIIIMMEKWEEEGAALVSFE